MYDKVCPTCGMRLSAYYKTGYLGCPDCYKAFETEIAVSLIKIQGDNVHKGKKPLYTSEEKELLNTYKRYIKEKERAGLEKRFKDMAKLTDYINQLGEELKRRGLI